MKVLSNLLICISLILFSCGGNNSTHQKSPEELRQELKMTEHQNFNQYLTVHNNDAEYKIWSDKYQIKGFIQSTASIARFKDAVLVLTFLTATDTELGSTENPLYEYIEPNSKTDFVITTKMPTAAKKFNIQIKTVTPVD